MFFVRIVIYDFKNKIMFGEYTYLIINLLTISYPLAQSFEHRVKYYTKWRQLLPSIMITGVLFIVWDILKTEAGVWSFNDEFIIGIYFINLPLEELLFFVTVPYSCVFIYEVLNYYLKKDYLVNYARVILFILGILILTIALINYDKTYTFVMFSLQGIYLLMITLFIKPDWLGRFLMTYFVTLLPFSIVNGFLTGLPVVEYNMAENLGIRIGTIPVEDSIYSMMLLMMNIHIYEYFRKRKSKKMIEFTSF